MAQQIINVGNVANDGQGDPLRTAFIKTNENFTELYNIGGLTGIQNGNSNITIAANSTINMAVTGVPDVVVVYDTGLTVTGLVEATEMSTTGNIYSDYYYGNGALLTGLSTQNASALTGTTLASGVIFSSLQQVGVLSSLSVAGNITGSSSANIAVGLRAGNILTTGTLNVGQGATFGNTITASGTISTTGNIVGNNIIGTFTFASLSTAGNVTGANLVTSGIVTAVGDVIAANFVTNGLVSAAGNVTGNYIIGNGSLLTGLPASYGNSNVAAYLPTYTGALTGSTLSLSGNIISPINTTSNITAPFYFGNGSQLTGVSATTVGTLPSLSVTGNAVIDGNLVAGSLSTTGNIRGSTLSLSGLVSSPLNSNSDFSTTGNIFGSSALIGILSVVSNVNTNGNVSASGNIIGSNLNGGTVLATTQVRVNAAGNAIWTSGSVTGSTLSATSGIFSGGVISSVGTVTSGNIITGGVVSSVGNVTGGNINTVGNVSGDNLLATNSVISNTVSAAENVTAGNILTGNIVSATGNIVTDSFFIGTFLGNITGNLVVPGLNTQVLYNNFGNAGASAGFTYDPVANLLVTGNIFGDFLYGNGAGITGIQATEVGVLPSLSVTGTTRTGNLSVLGNVLGNLNVSTAVNSANIVTANVLTDEIFINSTLFGTNVYLDGPVWTLDTGNAIWAAGNITGSNIVAETFLTAPSISISGNIDSGQAVNAANVITGNIVTDDIFINTTLQGTNVYLDGPMWTLDSGNAVWAAGDITGNNLYAVNIVSAGGNVISGNVLTGGIVTATGNITGGNVRTGGIVTATGNITGGNINTGGRMSATGNVVGNNLVATNLVVLSVLGSDPPGITGAIYFNNSFNKFRGFDGSLWANIN